jgi:hypothetical protein
MTALSVILVGGIVAFLDPSEFVINGAVFASKHNWFHR